MTDCLSISLSWCILFAFYFRSKYKLPYVSKIKNNLLLKIFRGKMVYFKRLLVEFFVAVFKILFNLQFKFLFVIFITD